MAQTHMTLGLDIGGTNLKAVLLEFPERIRREWCVPSQAQQGPEAVRTAVGELIKKIRADGQKFTALGVGCAGSIDHDRGVVRNSPNFSHWDHVPLKEWLERDHGVPTVIENDANCAVVTEHRLGNGKGKDHVLLLTLGTGVGGGIISKGALLRGATGTGGEVGHFSLNAEGVPCPCGNQGCFERYCSASALKRMIPDAEPKAVFHPGATGELKAARDHFLHYLKVGLVSLANVLDPEVILLGGGVAEGLGPYYDEIRQWVRSHAFPAVGASTQVLPTLFHNNSGAVGGALLAGELSG